MSFGIIFGMVIQNGFLSVVLGVGLALLPFWYVKLTEHSYKKELNEELETALSVITTAFIRSENIIKSVEENIYNIHPPVSNVFEEFLLDTKYISASTPDALLRMSEKINNSVFKEWCYAVIACQDNRNLKFTLSPIVRKFSDVRIVTDDLSMALYDPLCQMLIVSGMVVGLVPLLYLINTVWFNILVGTWIGKVMLAIDVILIFIALSAGIRLAKPVEYKR
jgi:Flp pilus assembly protein TadB